MKSSSAEGSKVLAPFEIGRFLVFPGRRLCGFLIEAKTERGVFRRILNVAAEHNARLKLAHFQNPDGKKSILVFFDCTECDVTSQALADEIRRSKDVLAVRLIEPRIEGIIADTVSNPLTMGGIRAGIMAFPVHKGLIRGVREHFGSGGAVFLYYAGFEIGKEIGKAAHGIGRRLGVTDSLRIMRGIIGPLHDAAGWGLSELIEFRAEPFYMDIKVYNSFECELGLGAGEPYSHLMRGFIAGCVAELFGVKVNVEEVRCIAKGDPYCEFIVKAEK